MQVKIIIKFGNWVINLKNTKKIRVLFIETKYAHNRDKKSDLENEGIKRHKLLIKPKIEDSQIKSRVIERKESKALELQIKGNKVILDIHLVYE